ncbi:MAG: hypothetical protein JOZ97_05965 [Candidatus Eremiobacteraeota bacterium]|nr:hypothetical protein [Candidatus Eremiobacteraeota bacterium]
MPSPSPSPSASPQPSQSPSPSPSPTPSPGFHLSFDSYTNFIDTAAGGPGLQPPEGPGFINGSPLSPMTPYDTFSSAAQTPGLAGIAQANITAKYIGTKYDASAIIGAGLVGGSMQNAMYWGENLMPTFNAHLGFTTLPYHIVFPTHAGQDEGGATAVAPLFGSIGAHDGSWALRGGFFDLNQSDRFVFVQPALTNVTPTIGIAPAETLGNGPPSLDSWPAPEPGLPLHGVDLTAHRGIASLELTNAALPSLPGTTARLSIASLVFDHGEGTRYSASFLHLITGGDVIMTSTLFGSDAKTNPGPQGPLPSSTLGGQVETIAGLRGAFHLSNAVDSVVEIGRAWYNASNVLEAGTNRPGGFYHLGFTAHRGRATLNIDGYRFEPRYATAILPYGTPENVWSVAWSWPGPWLKSTYQLADNTILGINRQGYRIRYGVDKGPLEVHASFATYRQVEPATISNEHQVGFVEGFYLPQFDDAATLGIQHQYGLWIAWHPSFGDLTLDYINDTMHRDNAPSHPEDHVSYQAPQAVLTIAHRFSPAALADVGFGRYAMRGSFASTATNVDYFQNVGFVGAQLAESDHAALLVQLRRSAFAGLPSISNGASPNFGATTLIVEQRFHY